MNCLKAPWIKLKETMTSPIKTTPVKTPVKSPKSPKSGPQPPGSVPKFSAYKYNFDIDVIKCPLCTEVFNSPRVLPCGHSACIGCLGNLILYTESSKAKDYFLCPVCQKTTRPNNSILKQKWAAQFPVNAVLIRILRNASTGSISEKTFRKAFCDICLKNNWTKATHAYCGICLEYQCEVCASQHEIAEETKSHEMTWFIPKKELPEPPVKVQVVKPIKPEKETVQDEQRPEGLNKEKREVLEIPVRERKFAPAPPIPPVVVAQTVTCSSGELGKSVIKLGSFDGKIPGDENISEFNGISFLTNEKVAMSDLNNKKIKVFDISHKTRVELINDIGLRASPRAICRIDENTLAVLTERLGLFHLRLLTLRDKLEHFVQKVIDGSAVGLAFISKTIICTYRNSSSLHKYRMSRAQQLKIGTIRKDQAGNELFTNPGVMTSKITNGCSVLYVADESEFGVTVLCTDILGRRKSTVFFESDEARPRKKVRTADVVVAAKSGRLRSRKSALKIDDLSETITSELEVEKNGKSSSLAIDKKARQSSGSSETGSSAKKEKDQPITEVEAVETLNLDLNQTFPKAQPRRQVFPSPNGRRSERLLRSRGSKRNLLNIDRNTNNNGVVEEVKELPIQVDKEPELPKSPRKEDGLPKSAEKRTRKIERKRSGKDTLRLETIQSGEILERPTTVPQVRKGDEKPRSQSDGDEQGGQTEADEVFERPKTVPQIRPKVYRADGLAVDNEGNIYICMCSSNRVHQMTPDGRVKRDLLSEKDGLSGPKAICFSPSNDVFLVSCANNNKVWMFRMK